MQRYFPCKMMDRQATRLTRAAFETLIFDLSYRQTLLFDAEPYCTPA
jgi:hypothetical protein